MGMKHALNEDAVIASRGFFAVFQDICKKGYYNDESSLTVPNFDTAIFSFPYIVNGAFACELALKSALSIEVAKTIRHDLFSLFYNIHDDYQTAIKNHASSRGLDEKSFDVALEQSKNLFYDWRYFYERDKVNIPSNFDIIVQSICITMFGFSHSFHGIDVPDR
ncbi:MAG: hypothetical protein ACC608_02985 [Anaerofustis sp.]